MYNNEEKLVNKAFNNMVYYSLVNNYGWCNERYEIRHILNVYGAECNIWELKDETKRDKKGYYTTFSTLEDLIIYVKNN